MPTSAWALPGPGYCGVSVKPGMAQTAQDPNPSNHARLRAIRTPTTWGTRGISTPWNEATLDPKGARFRRTAHDDPAFLDRLDEALT